MGVIKARRIFFLLINILVLAHLMHNSYVLTSIFWCLHVSPMTNAMTYSSHSPHCTNTLHACEHVWLALTDCMNNREHRVLLAKMMGVVVFIDAGRCDGDDEAV